MRKAGGTPLEYLRITMFDVVITHVEPVAESDTALEHVALSFARMTHEYILQSPLGSSQGTVSAVIDVKENQAA